MAKEISYKQLDEVLKELQKWNAIEGNTVPVAEFFATYMLKTFDKVVANGIWQKLIKDDYIKIRKRGNEPISNEVYITIDGFLLLKMEKGYEGRLKKERSEKVRNNTISVCVAIGTLGAVIFGGISAWNSCHNTPKITVIKMPIKILFQQLKLIIDFLAIFVNPFFSSSG